MKNTFVLDEGILYCAQTGEDEHGNPDVSSAQLLLDLVGNCHRIAVNAEILNKYNRQFSALGGGQRFVSALNVVNLLRNTLFNSEKTIDVEHATPLEDDMVAEIPDDDLPFVSAAVTAQAILVTVDDRLRAHLNDCGAIERYSLQVLRPEEAAPLAGTPNS